MGRRLVVADGESLSTIGLIGRAQPHALGTDYGDGSTGRCAIS